MSAASDARDQLAKLIRRAQDEARKCTSHQEPCQDCESARNVAMAQADIFATHFAAHFAADGIDKALAPYRLAQAAAEHSPRMGRGAS